MKYIHYYLGWLYNIIQTIFFRCSVESKCAHIKRIYKRSECNSLEQLRAIVQLLQQRCFICWGGIYGVVGLGAIRLWAICLWGFQYWSMCFVKSDDADVPVRLLKCDEKHFISDTRPREISAGLTCKRQAILYGSDLLWPVRGKMSCHQFQIKNSIAPLKRVSLNLNFSI